MSSRKLKARAPLPEVQECLAYEKCRERQASCDVCLGLPIDKWKEHVHLVLFQ
jgi:hypothetical protein